MIDISRLSKLHFYKVSEQGVCIGSCTTYAEILESPLLKDCVLSLLEAAATIGFEQARQGGTIGGNIRNASPAANILPPLLLHNAVIYLIGQWGERSFPLDQLLISPGQTEIASDEIIDEILIPCLPSHSGSAFFKMDACRGMAIAIVIVVDVPTAIRCTQTEAFLVDRFPSEAIWEEAAGRVQNEICPIDDIRATAFYRRHAVSALLRRSSALAAE